MPLMMLKRERESLERLSRDAEQLAKAAADVRATELATDFEQQLATIYSFDQQLVWEEAHRLADVAASQAQSQIAEQCVKLGIPQEFAPRINLRWDDSGENASKKRRAELRKAAYTKIEALNKAAKTQISLAASKRRIRLMSGPLDSDEATKFSESMPTALEMMPKWSLKEIEATTTRPR
jgi:hypothetical protein